MDFNDTTIQPKSSSGNRCYTVQDLQDILGVGRKSVYGLLKLIIPGRETRFL